MLSLRRAPNLGMSCVLRSLMPPLPLEPTSALEPPPIFSHPMASAVRPPRQLAPTVGQLEVLAGSMLQTGIFSDSNETVTLEDDVIDALAASFAMLRISDAPTDDEYPRKVHSFSNSPLPINAGAPAGAMDLCMEVFVTDIDASSSL